MSANKLNILFVINPISGGRSKIKLPTTIANVLDKEKFNAELVYTERVGHASEIVKEALSKHYDVFVAVGGDGTINEVAGELVNTSKTFAIIPLGSGNGLARFLKIPLKVEKALQLINTLAVKTIDTAEFNGRKYFNMAGVGFDAHLSAVFAGNKNRGLKSYVQLGLKEIINYKSQPYQIDIDGVSYDRDAFAISIANSSQYGNNVYISPESSLTDGLLDVCIIHPITFFKLVALTYQMITAKTHKSNRVTIIRGKNITIKRQKADALHVDGEPVAMGTTLHIKIIPASLNIIAN